MKPSKLNIAAVLLLIVLMISGSAKAADSLEASLVRYGDGQIDICGNTKLDKEIIFMLSIGSVSINDSLYGFNFGISYDRDKLKFTDLLKYGTLAETLQEVGYTIIDSVITGYAANINYGLPQVYGNKPLIAFRGEYVGECPDTTSIKIEYLEFTDEFHKVISKFNDLVIDAKILDLPVRTLKLTADSVVLVYDTTESEKNIRVKIQANSNNRISNIILELKSENIENFEISDIYLLSDKFSVDSIDKINENTARIYLKVDKAFENEDFIELKAIKYKSIADTAIINVKIWGINTCSCVTRFEDTQFSLISIMKDTTHTEVTENSEQEETSLDAFFDNKENTIVLKSFNDAIISLKLFDIMGNIVYSNDSIQKYYFKLQTNNIINGAYIAIVRTYKNQHRKIIIKY